MTESQSRPVAYLVSEYPKLSHTFILREIAALRALGLSVESISLRLPESSDINDPIDKAEYERTYYVQRAGRDPVSLITAHWRCLLTGPGLYFRTLWAALVDRPAGLKTLLFALFYFGEAGLVARRLKELNARHLHVHFANSGCSVGVLAAALAQVPYSLTMHGPTEFFDVGEHRLKSKVDGASFVACISYFCRSQLMLTTGLENWSKLQIVRCGVIPEGYRKLDRAPGQRLVFVGRLASQKGLPVLLRAFAGLRKLNSAAQLTLVGDGPDRALLEGLAKQLGVLDWVQFAGSKSQTEVSEILSGADLFVLPSFAEGVPVVLMEAMATGLPVVATRVGGIAELVEDGTHGRLVAPGDPVALTNALGELMNNPHDWPRMGRAGRAKVARQFDVRTEAARLVKLFNAERTAPPKPREQQKTSSSAEKYKRLSTQA